MKRIFGQAKPKEPPPTLADTSTTLDKRGDVLNEKIRKLDVELHKFREQMKRVRTREGCGGRRDARAPAAARAG